MKSLYESILGTNNASLASTVKQWVIDVLDARRTVPESVDVKSNGKGFDIDIKASHLSHMAYMVIYDRFMKDGDLPYKINSITCNGKELELNFDECSIRSFKNFPEYENIIFSGCVIEDLSSLPKSYKNIKFVHSHSLAGGKANYIGRCEGLKIDKWLSDGKGYSFAVNRFKNNTIKDFKNNTIKDFCLSCHGFNEQAVLQVVEEIIKNNNIKLEDITVMFNNDYKHVKINRARVEKKKGEYVIIKDSKRHREIYNG